MLTTVDEAGSCHLLSMLGYVQGVGWQICLSVYTDLMLLQEIFQAQFSNTNNNK